MERAVLSWSGGKESALALWEVRRHSDVEVVELLTMTGAETGRTSFHGVREDLLRRQAAALGLPVTLVSMDRDTSGEEYADVMAALFGSYADRGITRLVLGDVFRDEPDTYREDALAREGFDAFYPLLGEDTRDLVERFLDAGFAARAVCVRADPLGRPFAGRTVDEAFLADLPAGVDPAGEDGTYHTFVTDGPPFAAPVAVETGRVVERDVGGVPMVYCDLLPAGGEPADRHTDR